MLVIDNDGPMISTEAISGFLQPLQSNKTKGLGLGLPIVCSIVEAHRGHLNLEPRASGGLQATLSIPLFIGKEVNNHAQTDDPNH